MVPHAFLNYGGEGSKLATLNVNVPRFYCLLRQEFLYDGGAQHGELVHACVFGAASIHGRELGFHVLTENGAVIWRLPLHALCHKPNSPAQPLDWLQFWDCISYEVTATVFERLQDSGVRVQFRDRYFAAQPNIMQWFSPAFVTPFQEKPDFVTNTRIWKVERETETTQAFFYDTVSDDPRERQVALYAKGLRAPG
jgi:hypothetical protein